MKKILMMALALCLVGGAALADTEIRNDSATQTATTTLSYEMAESQSYTVTIPASVDLQKGDNNKLSGSLEIKLNATGFNVSNRAISVNLYEYRDTLLREGDTKNKIQFRVYKGLIADGEQELIKYAPAISWQYGDESAMVSQTLLIEADYNSSLPAGAYTGSLTFEVKVKNIMQLTNKEIVR